MPANDRWDLIRGLNIKGAIASPCLKPFLTLNSEDIYQF